MDYLKGIIENLNKENIDLKYASDPKNICKQIKTKYPEFKKTQYKKIYKNIKQILLIAATWTEEGKDPDNNATGHKSAINKGIRPGPIKTALTKELVFLIGLAALEAVDADEEFRKRRNDFWYKKYKNIKEIYELVSIPSEIDVSLVHNENEVKLKVKTDKDIRDTELGEEINKIIRSKPDSTFEIQVDGEAAVYDDESLLEANLRLVIPPNQEAKDKIKLKVIETEPQIKRTKPVSEIKTEPQDSPRPALETPKLSPEGKHKLLLAKFDNNQIKLKAFVLFLYKLNIHKKFIELEKLKKSATYMAFNKFLEAQSIPELDEFIKWFPALNKPNESPGEGGVPYEISSLEEINFYTLIDPILRERLLDKEKVKDQEKGRTEETHYTRAKDFLILKIQEIIINKKNRIVETFKSLSPTRENLQEEILETIRLCVLPKDYKNLYNIIYDYTDNKGYMNMNKLLRGIYQFITKDNKVSKQFDANVYKATLDSIIRLRQFFNSKADEEKIETGRGRNSKPLYIETKATETLYAVRGLDYKGLVEMFKTGGTMSIPNKLEDFNQTIADEINTKKPIIKDLAFLSTKQVTNPPLQLDTAIAWAFLNDVGLSLTLPTGTRYIDTKNISGYSSTECELLLKQGISLKVESCEFYPDKPVYKTLKKVINKIVLKIIVLNK
ncbi:MAG: hypothetical protein NkDv07_0448 [Candidatus Improbicoccus devescovinae]|nr:MAG: hypothetical protein NkDv07_0448 [Candidatus Improbicoccus devescovinae]